MSKNTIARNHTVIGRSCREQFVPVRQTPRLSRHGVQLAGVSDLAGSYVIERSFCEHHVLVYTLAGSGWMAVAGQERTLGPGDLMVHPAGCWHRYGLAGESWRIVWAHVSDTPEWEAVREWGQGVRASGLGEQLARLLLALILDPPAADADAGAETRDLLAQLLLRHLHREFAETGTPREREIRRRLHQVFAQVNAGLQRPWTTAELAKNFCASPVHFNRLCQEVLGQSPLARVTELRMARAAELLRSTDWTLAVVAEQVGYATSFAFSTAFKRWAGQPPAAYRAGR